MAFDQTTRNRLARFVSDTRALLTEEFTRQLQNEYGLDPASGEVTPIERLTALDDRRRETAHILRETLDYYLAGNPKADAKAYQNVLERIVREQAFTVLNRLCALRMSEARELVLESIAKEYQSKGFQLYARLAGSALGETGETYRMYLFSLMDEFAVDLPVLFDRFSPQGRLFPREAALLKLLELINDVEIESLWSEDETIGWIYQYFNSKEERKAMREASQAPRNSRELAVRNQFFTPRYVVEFLTDNTLGRIWYEMTHGETVLKDSCRYLVRRKHSLFLEEGQEAPEPFLPEQRHETDPDLAHEMWLPPNEEITDLNTIFLYGLTAGGYDYAREQWGIECGDLANEKLKQYHETGKWEGTFDELRCCLFFEQRRYHHFGEGPEGDDAKAILDLYQEICECWNLEVEFIPHRPLKDPREIKMLDPACGSMHFGLYAFDLFEQIYAEAWELEERLGEDALQRLADLDSLHKTYLDKQTFLKDVPRLIIERNIHGVDIDPRAVQIAGLSLWLRAQKSWQAQGLHPTDRPQIRKSNVVCAEPMPGDRQMLEEFLGTLRGDGLEALMRKAWHVPADQKMRATPQMADALAKLVRTVWQEMELAGEAGSLLKIEETLREAIATARKEAEEKSPLFRVLEYGLDVAPKEQFVQLLADEDQGFFDQAEGLVLAALQDYAERAMNGDSYRRLLFIGDAVQGFAFIDLCRKHYDFIVMNPPFGDYPKLLENVFKSVYKSGWIDLYACFIIRAQALLALNGLIGCITSRTYLYLRRLSDFRSSILLDKLIPLLIIDLGGGVLDTAAVDTCISIFSQHHHSMPTVFVDLREITVKDKNLENALHNLYSSKNGALISIPKIYICGSTSFKSLPDSVFAYYAERKITKLYSYLPILEVIAKAYPGLTTLDNDRFLRLSWEVPIKTKRWTPFSKGGNGPKFYQEMWLSVDWNGDGKSLKQKAMDYGGAASRFIASEEKYFRSGLTYPRVGKDFSVRVLPCGCIFAEKGIAIFPHAEDESERSLMILLGFLNSDVVEYLVSLNSPGRFWESGSLNRIPIPNNLFSSELDQLALKGYLIARGEYIKNENSRLFVSPFVDKKYDTNISNIQSIISETVNRLYGIPRTTLIAESDLERTSIDSDDDNLSNFPFSQLSYSLGCIVGRWNIEYAKKGKPCPDLPSPFSEIPNCPPGMLQNCDGSPVTPQDIPEDYPLRISWSGIIVDDEGHSEDIETRVRDTFQVIWLDRADSIEQETCLNLSVHSIREYFRKPTLFFAEHLKCYSKSRRAAPIYWPLSTPSCSYTLWLYYHHLNNQTLYTCVNDFVDPKLKQVSEEAAHLRLKKSRSTADEKEMERLIDFERELKDFRDELLRVAKFWKPNLNDGVEITAAPLWKLFQHKPWQKRLKETWQKLEAGEYDWAHLAYSIWPERVREKCKSDKSLAIAHDLESLYLEPPVSAKKKKAKKQSSNEESEGWFNDE